MRNLYLLICVAAVGIMFSSCKKEDKNSSPESAILGKWKGEKSINVISMNGVKVESDTSFWKTPDYMTLEFKKDNQLIYTESYENDLDTEELYYKIIGDKLNIMEDANDLNPEEYSFKLKGKSLILSTSLTEMENGVTWKLESEIYFVK
jgi:hypothetical protein